MTETIDLTFEERINFAKEYKAALGEPALNMLYRFKIIEKFLEKQNKPHFFFQILKNFLFTITSQDPTSFHYEIVRKALSKIDEKEVNNTLAIDLLTRAFVEACNKFNKKLKLSDSLEKIINYCRKNDPYKDEIISYYLDFVDCTDAELDFEKEFFCENGLSIWDNIYLRLLEQIGTKGKKLSKEIGEKIKKKKGNWDQQFWFQKPTPENPFFYSTALIILASVLWEDDVKKRIKFSTKNVPALTTNIQNPISKMLAPKNKVIKCDNSIQVFHQDSLLGIAIVPTIPHLYSTVFNGAEKLNTVTGHRFIRHLVVTAFEQLINGNSDYRVLKFDRGASDISAELGLNGKQHITNIKEILHAMAYFEFRGSQLTGNLIQLSKYKSPITGRQDEGYLITIGPPLLPYQTFEAYKNGSCNLLIPLLKDPPLVGSSRSHAGQYLLQMNLMGELSKNSIQLVKEGGIQLSEKKLEEFAQACGLTSELLTKVLDRWTQDGNDGAKFLERIDGDFYTLGPEHYKALEFLKRQGELRIKQSNRGKSSAIKRSQAKHIKKTK